MLAKSPITSKPRSSVAGTSNSPIRRRSLVSQTQVGNITNEERTNDDDAERLSLVASEQEFCTSTPKEMPRQSRDSMLSSPQKEHFQGCLKLYAENKINKDNVWKLHLIDYMASMVRRQDARMDDLQIASTVIDASARIYSLRVDSVHHDVLKMAGGLNKAAKDEEQQESRLSVQEVPVQPIDDEKFVKEDNIQRDQTFLLNKNKNEGSIVKTETFLMAVQNIPSTSRQVFSAKSKRSSSSSALARKKNLELEAAEARAKIKLDLIKKRLAANLADIDDDCSVQSDHTNKDVEDWLERSHRELKSQPVHDKGQNTDAPCPPITQDIGTDGTVHLLASALKDLAAASNNNINSNLISRICTPKDLPVFTGDPMKWLQFKQAYEESSKTKRGKKDDENGTQDENPTYGETAAPKKKNKRSKRAVAENPEVLNGDFDTYDYIDPFFERLAATPGNVTSINRAFNAMLPIDDETYTLKLNTDDPFLEPIQENTSQNINLNKRITIPIKLLPAFTESDQICKPFAGFSMTNWDSETEDNMDYRITNWVEENRLNLSQQDLAFDVNAEVEPIPQDDAFNGLQDDEPPGGIESEEMADVAVAATVARSTLAPPVPLMDMRPTAPHHSRLEYSYNAAVMFAWAGPAHWRLKHNTASKITERTQATAGRGKKPPRTKRKIDFLGAGLAFNARATNVPDYEPTQPTKITISSRTLALGHNWNQTKYETPIYRGLDESHFRKLFLRQNILMMRKKDTELAKSSAEPVTVEETTQYDYNNENDQSYCSNNVPDGDIRGNEDATAAGGLHDQVRATETGELGELIEPPAMVAKNFIPYAKRPKKVDMKQLNRCTWKLLAEETPEGDEDVPETTFSSLYARLPQKLSTDTRESLSVSLALQSLLHVATEKGLILEKKDDLKDIGILGLIKK